MVPKGGLEPFRVSLTPPSHTENAVVKPLSALPPPIGIPLTTGMLSGKTFSTNETPPDAGIIQFAADGTATEYHGFFDDFGNPVYETFSWNWSIDGEGRLIIDRPDPETDGVATLLAETATYLEFQVQFNSQTETGRLTKVIPFVEAQVPGTYTVEGAQGVESITFVAGGTGFLATDEGTVNFTWSLDGAGVMNLTTAEWSRTVYLLAGSTTSTLNIVNIAYEGGTPVEVNPVTFIRQ